MNGRFAYVLFVWLAVLPGVARADTALVHIVRPGETLASIAELWYGDPQRESVLVAENGLSTEGGSAIEIGLRLVVPTVSFHRVDEGETWAELATRFYGDPRRAFVLIEANGGKSAQPDPGAVLLVPYPLRHVADQNEPLRKLAKMYYESMAGMNTIRRFNETAKRVVRGQILLVPLSDLVLGQQGKKLAEAQLAASDTDGEVRAKQARIDEELPTLREHVRAGRYADAVVMANRLIGGGDLSGSQIETIHRELGTALCALDRDDLAREAFTVLLGQQPDAELDGVRTSPKVLRVFDQARKALESAEQQKAASAPRKAQAGKKGSRSERKVKAAGSSAGSSAGSKK